MIFTDRKITIRNGKSSINEPVILYRGDYEVSIKFTIMESKFRFKSGVNLVDSEKASHGQLAILAPYGGNVFSEIVKCEDGTVTFTLTKEMIDQLEEVGLYSFQIRLFDYYRESRVSIPPVEFGIEVREPVASEDHDNEVNNAIVGYSIAKVVEGLNEDVPGTFDVDGNYNKTDWETGDRITEGKLNKIEDALDKINQNEKNDVAALDKRITNNFNVLDANKANKNEVFSMKNMGQDVKEAMTGGSVAVVGKNAVLTENILDGAVTTNKQSNITLPASMELGLSIDTAAKTVTVPYQRIIVGGKSTITQGITMSFDKTQCPYNNMSLYWNVNNDTYKWVPGAVFANQKDERYTLLLHLLREQWDKVYCNGYVEINGMPIHKFVDRKKAVQLVVAKGNATVGYPSPGLAIMGGRLLLDGVQLHAVAEDGTALKSYYPDNHGLASITLEHNQVLLWDLDENELIVQNNNVVRPINYMLLLYYSNRGKAVYGELAQYVNRNIHTEVVIINPPLISGGTVNFQGTQLYALDHSGKELNKLVLTAEYTLTHNQVLIWNFMDNSVTVQHSNEARPVSYSLLARYMNTGDIKSICICDGILSKYASSTNPRAFHQLVMSLGLPSISAYDGAITINFGIVAMFALNKFGKEIRAKTNIGIFTLQHNQVLIWDLYENAVKVQNNNDDRPSEYVLLAYYNKHTKPDGIAAGELLNLEMYRIEKELLARINNIEVGDMVVKNDFLLQNKLGLVSHRGFHSHAPENSIKAVSEAGQLGYEMVELDLQVTSDGELVLMHDNTIDRTTNGSGAVGSYTLAELQSFVLDEAFSGYDPDDIYRIPTFDEACAEARKYGMGVNVDCSKMTWTEPIIHKAVAILKKHNIWTNSFFVLSNQTQRDLMASLYPDVNVTWLSSDSDPSANLQEVAKYLNGFITYNISNITDGLIQAYGDAGIPLFIYGCNSLSDVYKFKGAGVRFVETDYIPEGSEL